MTWKAGDPCIACGVECKISSIWGEIAMLIPLCGAEPFHELIEKLQPVREDQK
jgi:hypothetical protein